MKMTLIQKGSWRAVKPDESQRVDPDLHERALENNNSLVKRAKTSKEAWDALQKAIQDDDLLRRVGLLDRLTSVKPKECACVKDYVDELVTTSNSWSEIGFEVND